MAKVELHIGEVRTAPNKNQYALIAQEKAKARVALLLIRNAAPQSIHSEVSTLALETWMQWRIEAGRNESEKITDKIRLAASDLLDLQ